MSNEQWQQKKRLQTSHSAAVDHKPRKHKTKCKKSQQKIKKFYEFFSANTLHFCRSHRLNLHIGALSVNSKLKKKNIKAVCEIYHIYPFVG